MSPVSPHTLTPIGHLRTGQRLKFDARHQPLETAEDECVLELLPAPGHAEALRDLEGFERVWLLWWFHRNPGWRPLVLPPRGPARKRGVFATRSPHRPNALGMTPVRLLGIDGLRLRLGPCDLVDGTPVFDIKPYVPAYDAFPGARAGWIDEVDHALAAPPRFTVALAPLALEQATWLAAEWQIDFRPRLKELLARDPTPHRTRRIRPYGENRFRIGCGAWQAAFSVVGDTVRIEWLGPAYPTRFLQRPNENDQPDRVAQLAFHTRWPDTF
jgi:tRNA (adenine37-N6)-methyltransferase